MKELDPIAIRQQHIEDNQSEMRRGQMGARLAETRTRRRPEPAGLEDLDQIHPDGQAVIDDEHGIAHDRTTLVLCGKAISRGPMSSRRNVSLAAPSIAASRGIP